MATKDFPSPGTEDVTARSFAFEDAGDSESDVLNARKASATGPLGSS